NQLTTGLRLNLPSDNPGDAAVVMQLQKTIEQRTAYLGTISAAKTQLSHSDTQLDTLTGLLRQAQQIASANVGSDVTADQRKSAAAMVESIYKQSLSIANTQYQGVYIFGGDRSTQPPFATGPGGGAQFVGSTTVLHNAVDDGARRALMVNGQDVFGAISARVAGTTPLNPNLSAATRLTDLKGYGGAGVFRGVINITNGGGTANVDLATADTVGDVLTRINAVSATTNVTAAIATDGNSIALTASAGTMTVTDVGGGMTARDLGVLTTAPAATVDGQNVNALVTPLTPIALLRGGAGLDAAGFRITNGPATADIDLTGVTTVGDLLNKINGSGTGVLAEVNLAGTGIDLHNTVQGTDLTVGELGGATATQLGVRTFGPATPLAELNNGKGVRTVPGADFAITRRDGTVVDVHVDGANTVQDVIDRINTANGGGPPFMAAFAGTGNGIVLTDTSVAGTGTFAVAATNFSNALEDLGLAGIASAGGVIGGRDVNAVPSSGIFTNLESLRKALLANDQRAITDASGGLKEDLDRVVRVRGTTGAEVQELEARESRLGDENVATTKLLTGLRDADFNEAITRFTTLQTSLQASLQTTAKTGNLSLMDYLG
ncbi:MAG TPA: flagellin hook IN motif-containing protein, partial [Tepidisphaeraceae bacterium]|nr:flagellin hook IN motif-containing protein [Tepidisphaeraceae bacterium]